MRCRVIGKRGGIRFDVVSCVTCISWPGCSSASALTLSYGCRDWVDFEDGSRIAPDVPAPAEITIEGADSPADIVAKDAAAKVDHIREALVDMLPPDKEKKS
jgi:hypothetical protein